MGDSSHAEFSPSSLELLEKCPCFEQDATGERKAAKDGTRLHKAIEDNDLSLCDYEEEEEVVTRCLNFLDKCLEDAGEGSNLLKEVKLKIEDMTEGTGDVIIVAKPKVVLIDWKFGRTPVTDASDNIQMQGYTLGVFHEYPDVDEVEVHIVQPRMDVLSTATYKRSDVAGIRDRIQSIIKGCTDPAKKESADEKACAFCGRKAICPLLAETALTVAKNIGLPMPIEFEPGRLIDPKDRAKAQVLSYILEDWAKKVRKYNTKAAVEDGIEIPGFSVRSRRSATSVVDMFSAVQSVLDAVDGISIDNILQACSLSIPKLVEQVYAVKLVQGDKETKKTVRENINELLKEYVSVPETVTFLQRKNKKTNEDIISEVTK